MARSTLVLKPRLALLCQWSKAWNNDPAKIHVTRIGVGMARDVKALTLGGILAVTAASTPMSAAHAGPAARGFVCGTAKGVPSTNAVKADGGQVPVIRWTSATFEAAGWSQERRCHEVSSRFNTYLQQGRLGYITTGRINGLPVICTARSNGGACDGLLYTLKPGQNATATLQNLLEIRVKARGPLNETTSRLYVSLDELMTTAQANASGGGSASSGIVQAQPANGLF
jgi:hypothetical protein